MNSEQFSSSASPVTEATVAVTAPTCYEWTAPEGGLVVRLPYDFVDELNYEVMKGFGAVPRRGAEVGGILIGFVEEEGRAVTITGFLPVACKHTRGPSYILEDEELDALESALIGLEPRPGAKQWAVGFYRSNTRDALELGVEDQDLLERFFPAEPGLCLMVRPFATRVSEATIFLRRDGKWISGGVESVFPFRRSDLGGGKRPKRPRPFQEMPLPAPEPASAPPLLALETPFLPAPSSPHPLPSSAPIEPMRIPIPTVIEFEEIPPSKVQGTWVWIPLSLVFLLLGIVLGFQIALSVSRAQRAADQGFNPYALDLQVVEFSQSLHLKWDKNLPAFRTATSGMLHIRDGDNSKTVEISREDIERGGVIYRNATQDVQFRLELNQKDRGAVSESIGVRVEGRPSGRR